ncbi:unnamed protein product [Heterobilharzia americana]|nr:unnamed protein product [Heterobilharzia americana]
MWKRLQLQLQSVYVHFFITLLITSCCGRYLSSEIFDISDDRNSVETNLTQPYQISLTITESSVIKSDLINLSQIMQNHGILLETSIQEVEKRGNSKITNFEILDISANLLTAYQQRNQNNLLNIIDLHPVKGIIKFGVPLDRERICNDLQNTDRQCRITLLIAAYKITSRGVDHHEITATSEAESVVNVDNKRRKSELICIELILTLLDINDNSPYFPQVPGIDNQQRVITIEEECPIGTMVSLPIANDMDSAEHGIVKYEFHPVSTPVELMQVFEIVQFRGLRIQCEEMTLSEIYTYNYSYVSYQSSNKDSLPLVPCLKVINRLDREEATRYTIRLVAIDSGGRKGETILRILIKDINDHAPLWPDKLETGLSTSSVLFMGSERTTSKPKEMIGESGHGRITVKYTFQVPECTNQRQLLRLNANDLDEPDSEYGRVSYSLNDQTQDFEQLRKRLFISGEYIYLTDLGLKDLNQANLTIIITAADGAGRSSDAWIHLLVQDCNDHKPMIIMRNNEFSVVENAVGDQQLVSLITVRDLDLTTSPNSEFQCSLNDTTYLSLHEVMSGPKLSEQHYHERNSNTMHLNNGFLSHRQDGDSDHKDSFSRQGRWVVYRLETKNSSSFDREASSYYNVLIQCSDKGSPMLTSNRLIAINIVDVNDNPPIFLMSNQPQSSHLSLLSTENHRKLLYQTYLSSNQQKIDQAFIYQFVLPENSPRGTIVGSVHAVDLDAGDNVALNEDDNSTDTNNQNFPGDNDSSNQRKTSNLFHMFNLGPNGDIQLVDEVDRETVDRYELHIIVSDNAKVNRLSSTATVIIKIEDVNDCRPEFFGDYVFEVVESYGSSTIHQILGSIVAADKDLGRNGSITYRLGSEQNNPYTTANSNNLIDNKIYSSTQTFGSRLIQVSHDGKLTVYGVIDREKTPVIVLTIVAEDNGIPMKLSNSVTVTIHVLDLNDNKPRFIESSSIHSQSTNKDGLGKETPDNSKTNFMSPVTGFKLNLSLDTNVGTLLTVFEAYDPDNGPNGTVVFDMAYSGTLGFSKEINSRKTGGIDEDDSNIPTFTLQPDGRLLLSKRLIYSDMISPVSNNLPKRYRRPDRLLIRVSDKGPTPEQSITSLQIFYFDPIDTLQNAFSENYFPVANRKNDIRNEHENSMLNPDKESGKSKYFAYKSNLQALLSEKEGGKSSSKSYVRSSELPHSKPFTLPAMYLLALAVCLALILVIISFACFYVKLKRTNVPDNGNEKYDNIVKTEVHGESLISSKKNVSGDIRLDSTLAIYSKKDLDDSQTLSNSGNKIISECGINTLNYRSLSPTYIVRDCDHVNFLQSSDAYTDTIMSIPHWTMDCSNYTPLSVNQMNSVVNSCLTSTISQNDSNKQFISNNNQRLLKNSTFFKSPESLYEDQSTPILINQLEFCKTLNHPTKYNLLTDNQVEALNIVTNNDNIGSNNNCNTVSKTFQKNTSVVIDSAHKNNKSTVVSPETCKHTSNKNAHNYNELSPASPLSAENNSEVMYSKMQRPKYKLFSGKALETLNSKKNSSNDLIFRCSVTTDSDQTSENKSNDLPQLTSSFV